MHCIVGLEIFLWRTDYDLTDSQACCIIYADFCLCAHLSVDYADIVIVVIVLTMSLIAVPTKM